MAFRLHCLNRDHFNLSLLKYRDFQGFMVTGKHSGTHWIKWMLSHALARRFGVSPPRYVNHTTSNTLVGHPKHERIHSDLPRIASSHSIAPKALQWAWVRQLVRPPPYALVVRDIHDVLISTYEKWGAVYGVPFSRLVAGDPQGDAFACDVWWYVRFMNRWGEVARRYPRETLVLRYEDFRANPGEELTRLTRHFNLPLGPADIDAGVAAGSRGLMVLRQDPASRERPVRPVGQGDTRLGASDLAVLRGTLDRHLRHDFGYPYFAEPRGFQVRASSGKPRRSPESGAPALRSRSDAI